MKAAEMISTLEHNDANALREILDSYPWFASAQIALARVLSEEGDSDATDQLSKAAVYVGTPGVLYDMLVSEGFEEQKQVQKQVQEQEGEKEEGKKEEVGKQKHVGLHLDAERLELTNYEATILAGAVSRSIEQEVGSERPEEEQGPEPSFAEASDGGAESAKKIVEETETSSQSSASDLEGLSPFAAFLLNRSKETGFSVDIQEPVGELAEEDEPKKDFGQLIDSFIKNEPRITPGAVEQYSTEDLAKKSIVEDEGLITETMAQIYAKQGKLEKARRAYRLLSLKYPEKSIYFAAQLKKLGKKTN